MNADIDERYLDIAEALQDGIDLLQEYGESFDEQDFRNWHWEWREVLDPALLVHFYEPDHDYETQYLIVSVLGLSETEDHWPTLRQALLEGDEDVAEVARWAMIEINESRCYIEEFFDAMAAYVWYKIQMGLDDFFYALAAFAKDEMDMVMDAGGYQPMLF